MELKEPQLQWHWRRQTLLLAEHLLKIKAEAAAKGEKVHFYILPHHRADGDAIGSAMALQRALCRRALPLRLFLLNLCPDFMIIWLAVIMLCAQRRRKLSVGGSELYGKRLMSV